MGAIENNEKTIFLINNNELNHIDEKIIQKYSSYDSFYTCNVGDIIQKFNFIKKRLPYLTNLNYAIRYNDEKFVINLLKNEENVKFECTTRNEVDEILKLNVASDNILFTHPIKSISHIRYANQQNIKYYLFDSIYELEKLTSIHICSSNHVQLLLQINKNHQSNKYGCETMEESIEILKFAKKLKFNVIGIYFNLRYECKNPELFEQSFQFAKELFDFGKTIGYEFSLLHVGEVIEDLDQYDNIMKNGIQTYFENDQNLEIVAEISRYLITSAFILNTTLIGKRKTRESDIENMNYCINEGRYISFYGLFFNDSISLPKILKSSSAYDEVYPSTLWGGTCDSVDILYKDINLPRLNVGDWIQFEKMGSKRMCYYTGFNGFDKTVVIKFLDEFTYNQMKKINTNLLCDYHFIKFDNF